MSVGFGFLGAGMVARVAVGPAVAATPGARLVAAASLSPDRAAALGAGRVHARYTDLLDDADVDVVYVALRTGDHARWALAALEAGKNVLVEKPLGTSAADVAAIAATAEASGRWAVEAAWWRWHPRTAALLAGLREGRVGAPRRLDAGFTFALDPAPAWRWRPGGGGALLDVGCYAATALLAAAGAALDIHAGDVEVSVRDAQVTPTVAGVDATTRADLELGGVAARLVASFTGPGRQWLVVQGDAGRVALGVGEAFTSWREPAGLWWDGPTGASVELTPAVDAYALMVGDVAAAVREGRRPGVDGTESAAVATLLDKVAARAARPHT